MSSYSRFLRDVAIWLVPSVLLWIGVTPFYNRFLRESAETVVRLTERPAVTHLYPAPKSETRANQEIHYLVITRDDHSAKKGFLYSVRTTDLHFPMVYLWAMFMAVPGVPLTTRLARTGWATLIQVFFHVILLLFWVKFAFATQLGDWSQAHYGSFAQTFWGLGKHLLDLPFKFGLPLILFAAYYYDWLLSGARGGVAVEPPRKAVSR
ncbi:MAG TPA: hypothetical protein VHR17_15890 [Thermoanaerobaculia bacterium]|jgi:hypothetical protein|nr:hypothetical protein [Thermoanaerobaculia bacterium]